MIQRICGVRLCDRKQSDELEGMIGLQQDIITLVGQSRLRWYGHVIRRENDNEILKVLDWKVDGTTPKVSCCQKGHEDELYRRRWVYHTWIKQVEEKLGYVYV